MHLPDMFVIQHLTVVEDNASSAESMVVVNQGKIVYAGPQTSLESWPAAPVLDGSGWIASPGWIDLQVNGAYGNDFTDQPETIPAVAARLPETGVTAFLPTFITSPLEAYPQKLAAVRAAQSGNALAARVLGAHLEGPFLNPANRGAHPASLICDPQPEALLYYDPLEIVRLVTLAAERPGGDQAIHWLRERGVVVSLGHSSATATEAQQAFAAGARYATHLYNAMPPLHHREPGLVGAVLNEASIRCGLIVDGIHCHPLMVNLAYSCKGPKGITLVTDAMSAMGMPPGQYSIGGQKVWVDETSARQSEGRLAGSILRMDQALRNMIAFSGCSLPEAIYMASSTPAEILRMGDRLGHLKAGYPADMVLLNGAYQVHATLIAGQIAYATAQAAQRMQPAQDVQRE